MEKINKEEWDLLVRKSIQDSCNKYFKCANIIDEVQAKLRGKNLKFILNEKRRDDIKFFDERASIRAKVREVLKKMHLEGKIKKYSRRFWEKL